MIWRAYESDARGRYASLHQELVCQKHAIDNCSRSLDAGYGAASVEDAQIMKSDIGRCRHGAQNSALCAFRAMAECELRTPRW
jgi:hypothetical protein